MRNSRSSYAVIAATAAAERVKNSCAHCKKPFNFTAVRKKCKKCKRYSILEYLIILIIIHTVLF
jgi:Zn finger protein HypA/HybF involved in hydrogenase expression